MLYWQRFAFQRESIDSFFIRLYVCFFEKYSRRLNLISSHLVRFSCSSANPADDNDDDDAIPLVVADAVEILPITDSNNSARSSAAAAAGTTTTIPTPPPSKDPNHRLTNSNEINTSNTTTTTTTASAGTKNTRTNTSCNKNKNGIPFQQKDLGRNPTGLLCQYCQQQTVTSVEDTMGVTTILLIILLAILFWPLCWLPCCVPSCKTTKHYCGHQACQKKIGATHVCA